LEKTLITVEGRKICLRKNSGKDPDKTALLFLHGNLGSGLWFESLLDRFDRPALAPDLPNFGDSDSIERWMIPDYSRWLVRICDALNLDRIILAAHSFGGAVAMDMAVSLPQRIETLILIDSSPVKGLLTPREHFPVIEAYRENRDILKKALQRVAPMLDDDSVLEQLTDEARKMKGEAYTGHAVALAVADYRGKAGQWSGPAFVIRGEDDILISREDALECAEAFGGEYLEIPDCGHSPMVERPDELVNLLKSLTGEG